MTADLFGGADGGAPLAPEGPVDDPTRPLADRLRPTTLEEVVGQEHLLGADGPLGRMLSAGRLGSVILWGPPGVGKTTVARLLAARVGLSFIQISAIFSGVAELRKTFETARAERRRGRSVLLFVDEIHRFNRAQQDSFLPHMEDGLITLVGATTENPSFELNAALLSRAQVMILRRLDEAALELLLARAEAAAGEPLPVTEEGRAALASMADGDGRACLTLAEEALALPRLGADGAPLPPLGPADLAKALRRRAAVYDKNRDGHYGLISALHKAVRGSDPDAALYWLCRMLEGGEDPMFLARRLVRMAVEDIGLADPEALRLTVAAKEAYHFLGSPEGELALAQATIHLALSPKSNATYVAYKEARRAAAESGSAAPPAHILNAPTALMKDQGFGAGYAYDHDAEDSFSGQAYFPESVGPQRFYRPVERGFEREMGKRLAYFEKLRAARQAADGGDRGDGGEG
ncbi:MAG: replication-associated recombination protein A [Pseudomonadota bacterium]